MAATSSPISAFVLAGGKSSRMGTDKAFVMLDGRTLLARALDLARSVTSDVRIIGSRAKFAAFAPVVEDLFPGCGPLAGIHAALRSSAAELNIVLAVDVPFLSTAFLEFLVERARRMPGALATVPQVEKGWQPLCAVYRRAFADVAETALRDGRYKIDLLFTEMLVQVVDEEQLRSAGFSGQMFHNLNTPEELAGASKVHGSEEG